MHFWYRKICYFYLLFLVENTNVFSLSVFIDITIHGTMALMHIDRYNDTMALMHIDRCNDTIALMHIDRYNDTMARCTSIDVMIPWYWCTSIDVIIPWQDAHGNNATMWCNFNVIRGIFRTLANVYEFFCRNSEWLKAIPLSIFAKSSIISV